MSQKRSSKDDKLIQDLYEKLNWFTFQASDEEFDEEQVRAILELLDKLDPLPGLESGAGAAAAAQEGAEDFEADDAGKSQPAEEKQGKEELSDNPAAAFERFKKRYNITDEDLARKDGKLAEGGSSAGDGGTGSFCSELSEEVAFDGPQVRRILENRVSGEVNADGEKEKKRLSRFKGSTWRKVAAAVIVAAAACTYLSVGTSAVRQKSFFEIVQDGVNSLKFTVTGNVAESETETEAELEKLGGEPVYYDSWEEAAEENSDILIPGYIPEGLELEVLYKQINGDYVFYNGVYANQNSKDVLIIGIEYYTGSYADVELINEKQWELIESDEDRHIKYYRLSDEYMALWNNGKCVYLFEWKSLADIDLIINQMKK